MLLRLIFLSYLLFVFSCGSNEGPDTNTVSDDFDQVEKNKDPSNGPSIAGEWLLSGFDTKLFAEKKTVDQQGVAKMEAALSSLIGIAFYNLKSDGSYEAGTGGEPFSGNWTLSSNLKVLTLQQPPKDDRTLKPTEFTIVQLSETELTMTDKDGLKVIFGRQ
ncbi:MAG: hypothetical protein AAF502_11675 [Bacteroidota bacterium]